MDRDIVYHAEKRCMAMLDFKNFGGTIREVAERNQVAPTTLWRWIHGFAPARRRRSSAPKLHRILAPLIQTFVDKCAHFTADTISQAVVERNLAKSVSRSTIYRTLKRMLLAVGSKWCVRPVKAARDKRLQKGSRNSPEAAKAMKEAVDGAAMEIGRHIEMNGRHKLNQKEVADGKAIVSE